MHRLVTISLITSLVVSLSACGGKFSPKIDPIEENLVDQGRLQSETPKTFVDVVLPDQQDLRRRVNSLNLQRVALINVIHQAMPDVKVIPVDRDVDLAQAVSIYTNNMSAEEFFEQLEGITDYDFSFENKIVRISSIMKRRWNLSPYATKRAVSAAVGQSITNNADSESGDSSQERTQTRQTLSFDEDSWADLIADAETVIGIENDQSNAQIQENEEITTVLEEKVKAKAYVVGSRRMGLIEAAGPPSKMRKLDSWFSELEEAGYVQINLEIRYYEVKLDDKRGSGVDWTAMFNGNSSGEPGSIELTSATPGFFQNSGIFSIGAAIESVDFNAELLFKFLQRFGKVELLTQPNVTVTNGTPAYISSGEEFSYQSSFEQSQDAQGQVVVTPQLSRLKVGVTLSVTARKLEGDSILVDVVPVITSLIGWDETDVGTIQMRTPHIALDELATQVITQSGKPIRLGGLISESIAKQVKKIPREGDKPNKFYDWIFKSQLNELERKELVISITPRIVGT